MREKERERENEIEKRHKLSEYGSSLSDNTQQNLPHALGPNL